MDVFTLMVISCIALFLIIVMDDKIVDPWTRKQIEKDLAELQKLREKQKELKK